MTARLQNAMSRGSALAIAALVVVSAWPHGGRPTQPAKHRSLAMDSLSAKVDGGMRHGIGSTVEVAAIGPLFEHHYP